jgi:CspA family cold shock protein
MPEGTVKWYDKKKGYGFVAVDDSTDVFVHYTNFLEGVSTLNEGDVIEFDIVEGEKGPRADNVATKSAAANL